MGRWLISLACVWSVTGCGVAVTESKDGYESSDAHNDFALMVDERRELQLTSSEVKCLRRDDVFTLSYQDKDQIADGLQFSLVMIGQPREGSYSVIPSERSERRGSQELFQMTANFADGESYVLDRYTLEDHPETYAALTFTRVTDFIVAGRLWIEDLQPVGGSPTPLTSAMGLRASFQCVRFH